MSRSYRKPKVGYCTGSNTEYYRDRNRDTRTKNRRILKKAWDDNEFDEVEFVNNRKNPAFDSWNEPTDGSFILTEKLVKEFGEIYDEDLLKKATRK